MVCGIEHHMNIFTYALCTLLKHPAMIRAVESSFLYLIVSFDVGSYVYVYSKT